MCLLVVEAVRSKFATAERHLTPRGWVVLRQGADILFTSGRERNLILCVCVWPQPQSVCEGGGAVWALHCWYWKCWKCMKPFQIVSVNIYWNVEMFDTVVSGTDWWSVRRGWHGGPVVNSVVSHQEGCGLEPQHVCVCVAFLQLALHVAYSVTLKVWMGVCLCVLGISWQPVQVNPAFHCVSWIQLHPAVTLNTRISKDPNTHSASRVCKWLWTRPLVWNWKQFYSHWTQSDSTIAAE